MQRIHRLFLVLVFLLAMFPVATLAWRIIPGQVLPVMMDVTPDRAVCGDVVVATGVGLGKRIVRDVYLVDGQKDYLAKIVDQNNTEIRFMVPADVQPGRLRLATTTQDRPDLLQQDVYLTVLEGDIFTSR